MLRVFSVISIILAATVAYGDPVASVRYLDSDGEVTVMLEGGATAGTPFTLASVAKTMTSVAVLRLVAEGKLSLDDMARQWIDRDISEGLGGLDNISLRHLLTMTSGLPDYLSDDYVDDSLANPELVQNQQTALSYAFDEEKLFHPGVSFQYSNTNYVLLGLILENVTGLNYALVMKKSVFDPVGMDQSFVFGSAKLPKNFPKGHEGGQHFRKYYEADGFGDGGVISTAGDLAKFYKALFVDHSLLPSSLLAELMRDELGEGYGMGIEIEGQIVGHSGGDLGFSSDVRMDLGSGDIAITLIAKANADTGWTLDMIGSQ